MAYEEGIITQISTADKAWIKTKRSSACSACSARHTCKIDTDEEASVEVINKINAEVGDRVIIRFKTAPLLTATFLLYVLPIISLIIGAFLGQKLSIQYNLDESLSAVVIGFAFLFVTVLIVKIKANKLSLKENYQPTATRIIRKANRSKPALD